MQVNFTSQPCRYLDTAVREVETMELTQEIRLSEGMPDVGKILCAWGQWVLRGKEWRTGSISCSAGLMVWVLYQPEDGSEVQWVDGWIPFQMRWDLPEGTPEGAIRVQCLPRFVDARNTSARKILVRSGISLQGEAFVPGEAQISQPEEVPEGVELLRAVWPLRLPCEAGEKTFNLDEELELPPSAPQPEKIVYFRMEPKVTERRVLGNKLVFRGSGNLHTLYRSREGQLHSWEFELPFSQFAQLEGEYGPDAQGDLILSPTSIEPELEETGKIRLKAGMAAQYLVNDKRMLDITEDAASPGRELEVRQQLLELPAVLETRREMLYPEQRVQADGNVAADVSFLPEFPRVRRMDDQMEVEVPGSFQTLYYGTDGALHAAASRWEGKQRVPAGEDARILASVHSPEGVQGSVGAGEITMSAELPMEMTAITRQQIPMVTGVTLGEPKPLDPMRPSLILRRAGEKRLWDIARESGTTMEAIRKANGLTDEPAPDRVLLIPVP